MQTVEPETEVKERGLYFFTKTVNTLRSIKLLFNSGDIVSARILMRSLFEITVQTKKLIKDKEIFIKYSKAYEEFKVMESSKIALKDEIYSFYTKEELDLSIEKAKSEIEDLGFRASWNENNGKPHVMKYFEIKNMADDVEWDFLYETAYKNLCSDTHTSALHFHKYFIGEGTEVKFNLHPYLHELDLMISIVIGFVSDFISDFCLLVNLSENNLANVQLNKMFQMCYMFMPMLIKQGLAKKNNIALVF